ncbi:uncharacterized protein LOC109806150 isoform X2 [Cajanus cajan]|uniref:uncharacterized protein LOC109806150 isoform X2 n=1 Tax=Cajanus cajan TaxID=3821 RepID=UPI00098D9F45|nr:uncharacterized protein LOC109806150 isoform X2 [Cajanus cajan]
MGIDDGSVRMLSSLLVTALSGCVNVLLTNPTWVVVTRMQGILVFASVMATLGLQIILDFVRTLISFVTLFFAFFLEAKLTPKLENAFNLTSEQECWVDHFFDVITNVISLIAALLANVSRIAMKSIWGPFGLWLRVFVGLISLCRTKRCCSLNDEGLTLLEFRVRITSDPFGALENWNPNDCNPCKWFGVRWF